MRKKSEYLDELNLNYDPHQSLIDNIIIIISNDYKTVIFSRDELTNNISNKVNSSYLKIQKRARTKAFKEFGTGFNHGQFLESMIYAEKIFIIEKIIGFFESNVDAKV